MDGYPIQTNFTAGEVSPLLRGRVDIAKYNNAARTLKNWLIKPQGGIVKRSGTRYVANVANNANFTILQKFEFSVTQTYIIEFGQETLRIYYNGALIMVGPNPLLLSTPYQSSDLQLLRFAQSASEMFVVHPNYPPMVLSQLTQTSWTFEAVDFDDGLEGISTDGPYLNVDGRGITMSLVGLSNAITLNSSSAVFSSGNVGDFLLYQGLIYSITSYVSTHTVNVDFINNATPSYTGGTLVNTPITIGGTTYPAYLQVSTSGFSNPTANTIVSDTSGNLGLYSGNYNTAGSNNQLGLIATYPITSFAGTLTILTQSGSITESALLTSTANDFSTSSVGQYVQYFHLGNLTIGLVTSYISPTQVTVIPFNNVIDSTTLDPLTSYSYSSSNITINNVTFTGRLYASISVWTSAAQYSFVRIGGTWYLTGYVYNGTVSVNGVSMQAIGIQAVVPMVNTTGELSISNHQITGVVIASLPVWNPATDVGRCMRFNLNGSQVWGVITAVTSTTKVAMSFGIDIPPDPQVPTQLINNGQTTIWQLGAWYTGNYPSVVTFHEDRMTFAATSLQPQTLWMSNSDDYFNFAPTDQNSNVLASNSINVTIASGTVNTILWMQSNIGVLMIGTIGAEWEAASSSYGSPLAPTNIVLSEQTTYGSLPTAVPWKVGSRILFIQRSGNKMKELSYFFQTNSFIANDMTILSEHIMREHGGGVFTSWQQEPNNTIWVVCNDGTLVGFTYDYNEQISGWFQCIIGGTYNGGQAVVESITSVPSLDGVTDTLYMVVKRTIGGNTVRTVEYMTEEFWPENTQADLVTSCFSDCSSTVTVGTATLSFPQLAPQLAGETVSVQADGSMRPQVVVAADGSVTIQGNPALTVTVGEPYQAQLDTLPLEVQVGAGTSQGKVKRLQRITLRLLNTIGFSIGKDAQHLRLVSTRDTSQNMGQAPLLYTNDWKMEDGSDYTLQGEFTIVHNQPYPMTLLATIPQVGVTL